MFSFDNPLTFALKSILLFYFYYEIFLFFLTTIPFWLKKLREKFMKRTKTV